MLSTSNGNFISSMNKDCIKLHMRKNKSQKNPQKQQPVSLSHSLKIRNFINREPTCIYFQNKTMPYITTETDYFR